MQYCFARALRATSNRKANRVIAVAVIAVNELYVLLSDQTVNVTHKTHTHTHSVGEETERIDIRNTYPTYT